MSEPAAVLRLHYYPSNASLAPHIALREIGVPFELVLVDRAAQAQHAPAYRRLNPTGRIPTLEDGDLVLWETAAILLHLGERFPAAGLVPPPGTRLHAQLLTWLFHLSNTPQAEMRGYFYPHTRSDDAAALPGIKAKAEATLAEMFTYIDTALGQGPFLLGATYTVADPLLLTLIRWGRGFARPLHDYPHLGPYAQRMLARPAVAAAFAAEGLSAPFV
ncbi:MAG: glutathione S-transferase family protein [Rhodospirillales bacterium]|nr:glutathione S-transferase family protein [Rhodospirillales bacterium]